MSRNRVAGSSLPLRGRALCNTCGTNLDIDDIEFSNQRSNLVYIDKVFSFNDSTSSPILTEINTGGIHSDRYVTELTLRAPGCSLVPCTLDSNAVFTITNSIVAVEYFNTRPPGNINAHQVSLDGHHVESVAYANGQYLAKAANVISRSQKDICLENNLPTKAFFLVENAGPWDFRARYILEGTVNTGGRNCLFRLEISNAENACNNSIPNNRLSTFAIPDLSLPCSINGVAPDILFQFHANIEMVNPRLEVVCGGLQPCFPVEGAVGQRLCPVSPTTCEVSLVTGLAVEPTIHVEVVRKTLFCINACEAMQPCDGSIAAAVEDEEDCIQDIIGPACRCGSGRVAGVAEGASYCREQVLGESVVNENVCELLCEAINAIENTSVVAGVSTSPGCGCENRLRGANEGRCINRNVLGTSTMPRHINGTNGCIW